MVEFDPDQELTIATINWIMPERINADAIRRETKNDQELQSIIKQIETGKNDIEFSMGNGIIFRGHRIIIPKKLQTAVLRELHATHVGVAKMKELARAYCHWSTINKDIEEVCRSCESCCDVKNNPRKVEIHPWEATTEPWARLHIDFAGPFLGYHFLILVDSYSKWIEVHAIQRAFTSASTIRMLSGIFSRFGLPKVLVSDNGEQFKSTEFRQWCTANGIKQRFSAPYNPSSNGQAERYVQLVKRKLRSMRAEPGSIIEKLEQIQMRYRVIPHSTTGKSPSELLLGRKIRTSLDLMLPVDLSLREIDDESSTRCLEIGERVQVRDYRDNRKWIYGTIKAKVGNVHYDVDVGGGRVWRRHINQIRRCGLAEDANRWRGFRVPAPRRTAAVEAQAEPVVVQSQDRGVRRSERRRVAPNRLVYERLGGG